MGGGPGAGAGALAVALPRTAFLTFGVGMANGSRTGAPASRAVSLSRLTCGVPEDAEVGRSPGFATTDATESVRDDAFSATAETMSEPVSCGALCTHAAATSVLTIKPAITNHRLRGVMPASVERR